MEQLALSCRGIQRQYGIDRRRIASAIASGDLPASRLGVRRLLILRADFEAWLRGHAVHRSVAHSEQRGERVTPRST